MKTGNLTRAEFAQEMCKVGTKIKMYNFDIFYDIKTIMELDKENRSLSEHPKTDKFHYFIRETGTWLLKDGDDFNKELFTREFKEYYTLEFCWNTDYIRGTSYCKITNNSINQ